MCANAYYTSCAYLLFFYIHRTASSKDEYPTPYYVPPSNILGLVMKQFSRNLSTMLGKYKEDGTGVCGL